MNVGNRNVAKLNEVKHEISHDGSALALRGINNRGVNQPKRKGISKTSSEFEYLSGTAR